MIRETITFTFEDEEQQRRFHDRLNNKWKCAVARKGVGANDPQDCNWPVCGCDPQANKVIEALQESGALPAIPTAEEENGQTRLSTFE